MERGCCLLALLGVPFVVGCFGDPEPITVSGPESADLLPALSGYIVMDHPVGGIDMVSLPNCTHSYVRPPRKDNDPTGSAHAIGGPDKAGRIAFIDNHMMEKRHELRVIHADGTNSRTLFSRPGDALWSHYHVMGDCLALAPTGGLAAFLSGTRSAQMWNPQVLLTEGTLETWDIAKGSGREHPLTALDSRLSWFPDGKRLAYAAFVPRAEAGTLPLDGGAFGTGFARWDRVPTVFVLDTATGKRTRVHVGYDPLVSSDGTAILVFDLDGRCRVVRAATGETRPVRIPGYWGNAFAFLDGDKVMYLGHPTSGAAPRYTESNSPLVGPKQMLSIKVADINTGAFQTVVASVDPRRNLSYGPGKSP